MNNKKVDEIMKKLIAGWNKRLPKGAKLQKEFLKGIKEFLKLCPDEDGKKRVTDLSTGKTHLVPYEDIILNGLKGKDLNKYPVEEK